MSTDPLMLEQPAFLGWLGLAVDDLIDILLHHLIGQRRNVEKLGLAIDAESSGSIRLADASPSR